MGGECGRWERTGLWAGESALAGFSAGAYVREQGGAGGREVWVLSRIGNFFSGTCPVFSPLALSVETFSSYYSDNKRRISSRVPPLPSVKLITIPGIAGLLFLPPRESFPFPLFFVFCFLNNLHFINKDCFLSLFL